MIKKEPKPQPQRPSDDLPPDQLQEAWDKYLDETVGSFKCPNWLITMDPRQLDILTQYLDIPEDYMKKPYSPKMELYLTALDNVLETLPLVQRVAIKKFYGIGEYLEPQTQEQIAKGLIGIGRVTTEISQQMAFKYIAWAKKNLKKLIRAEVARLVKEGMQK